MTDRLFAEIAALEGFEVVGIHEVRSKRTGKSVVNSAVRVGKAARPTRIYETAVELRGDRVAAPPPGRAVAHPRSASVARISLTISSRSPSTRNRSAHGRPE